MKTSFYLLFFFWSINAFGQAVSFDSTWKKNLSRRFMSTHELGTDSCYYSSSLLKIDLDNDSKIISIQFSDYADTSVRNSFINILNTEAGMNALLESEARKEKVKNLSLIVPVNIISWGNCPALVREVLVNKNLYTFNNKNLTGNCLFLEAITILTVVLPGKKSIEIPAKTRWNK